MQEVACNVAGYEQFLETRLRTDLYDASSLKQAFSDEQEDFRALEQNLHLLLKVCDTVCQIRCVCVLAGPQYVCRVNSVTSER